MTGGTKAHAALEQAYSTQRVRLKYFEALETLHALAAKRPDVKTSSGAYSHEDDLIGALLREKGFDAWERIDGKHIDRTSQLVLDAHLKTHALLDRLQRALDYRKMTWSDALAYAERWVERHPDAWSWVDWPATSGVLTPQEKQEAISRAW